MSKVPFNLLSNDSQKLLTSFYRAIAKQFVPDMLDLSEAEKIESIKKLHLAGFLKLTYEEEAERLRVEMTIPGSEPQSLTFNRRELKGRAR